MFSLSNWLYLGVGLGLGLSFGWLRTEQSEPKQLSEQLKASQLAYHLADQMSQFKAGFLARVSHELRSPLNSMIGLQQLILADLCDNPEEEREFVAQANQSALKFVSLLDKILDVARIERSTSQLEIQPLQLSLILAEVYQLTYLLAVDRNLQLYTSSPDPEIYILADRRWLRQVLVSLIETSIAQMLEGSIRLSTTESIIWLDVELDHKIWSEEPVNLLLSTPNASSSPTPGMTLLLNQTVLELMNSRLEIIPITTTDICPQTRFQLTIPLG